MIEKDDAKQNRVVKRALHILYIIDKYGRNSPMLTNYISDCMESDIRRERKATKELLGIINGNPCEYQTQKERKV